MLAGTALAVLVPAGTATVTNPGPHGFSQILYAFSSAGNNNGSAFAGLGVNNLFYNTLLGIAMLISRYWLIVPVLAITGSLARKKYTPISAGTLPTHALAKSRRNIHMPQVRALFDTPSNSDHASNSSQHRPSKQSELL